MIKRIQQIYDTKNVSIPFYTWLDIMFKANPDCSDKEVELLCIYTLENYYD